MRMERDCGMIPKGKKKNDSGFCYFSNYFKKI